jgi:predicted Zn finger-like uncharacterized protein
MKFQCDHCKTRYSIADERVHGKVLKIRCKNCASVITVREGVAVSSRMPAAKVSPTPAERPRSTVTAASNRAERQPRSPQAAGSTLPGPDTSAGRSASSPSASDALAASLAAPTIRTPVRLKTPGVHIHATPGPAKPAALHDAFNRIMGEGPGSDGPALDGDRTVITPAPAPPQLDEEWYLSFDGEQFGPLSLTEARQWVKARSPADVLYCWSEGFDDWLLVEKVSQFKGLRRAPSPSPARSVGRPPPTPFAAPASGLTASAAAPALAPEPTPQPLFAAALAALEEDEQAPTEVADPAHATALMAAGGQTGGTNGHPAGSSLGAEFDLEIGEVSRVVKLPTLPAPMLSGNVGAASVLSANPAAVAQVGKITGGEPVLVPLAPARRSRPLSSLLPPIAQGRSSRAKIAYVLAGVVALGLVIGLMVALSGGSEGEFAGRSARARASVDGLGQRLDPRTIRVAEPRVAEPAPRAQRSRTADKGARSSEARPRSPGLQTSRKAEGSGLTKVDDAFFGEGETRRPLDGDDLMTVYRDNRLAVTRCYERALKKDPLLDVKKLYVSLSVDPSGAVTNVALSSHASTTLGTCLAERIGRWRFRKSPEPFSGRFPLVFRN